MPGCDSVYRCFEWWRGTFFSFYFYWFHLADECFMDIIHLSIFFKFTEDLTFLLVKVWAFVVGSLDGDAWSWFSAGLSLAILSAPLRAQCAFPQLVSWINWASPESFDQKEQIFVWWFVRNLWMKRKCRNRSSYCS